MGKFKQFFRELKPFAEQGNIGAQFRIGIMYYEGLGVTKDDINAVKWYTLAAEQASGIAQNNLARMYKNGYGVIQDNIYTHMWANISASNGVENGFTLRDRVAKEMTSADISQAQKLARECVAKNYKDC